MHPSSETSRGPPRRKTPFRSGLARKIEDCAEVVNAHRESPAHIWSEFESMAFSLRHRSLALSWTGMMKVRPT